MMLAAALPGLACSCASYEKVLACEIFHKAPIIFRGRVVDHNHDPRLGFVQWTLYRFRIEEMFKGLPSSVKEVFIDPASFTSCYGEFHSNADYLIYTGGQESLETFSTYYSRVKSVKNRDGSVKPLPDAWKDLGDVPVFPVGLCSPSGTIQDDDPDLTYLRLASQGKLSASGSIQGIAAQNAGSAFLFGDHLPVAGATITATKGSYTWNSITAADGSYSIPQLPPGKYTLSAASADFGVGDFKLRAPDVEVVAGGCVVARASFGTSATITGTVLNHQGRAATGVYIQAAAVSANGTVKIIPETWARSDLRGEFTVRNVPAGEIVVGANINSSPTFEEPYDTVYVPAAASVDAARVFTLKPDDQVKGVILRLPQPLPFANLFVDVLWPDGSPATAGARAFAEWNGRRSALERAPVEGNRVRLPLALGRTYQISADWLSDRNHQFVLVGGEKNQSVAFSQEGQTVTIRLKETRPR
jgi:hypothetical protein